MSFSTAPTRGKLQLHHTNNLPHTKPLAKSALPLPQPQSSPPTARAPPGTFAEMLHIAIPARISRSPSIEILRQSPQGPGREAPLLMDIGLANELPDLHPVAPKTPEQMGPVAVLPEAKCRPNKHLKNIWKCSVRECASAQKALEAN